VTALLTFAVTLLTNRLTREIEIVEWKCGGHFVSAVYLFLFFIILL